jgi:hypothetical protein
LVLFVYFANSSCRADTSLISLSYLICLQEARSPDQGELKLELRLFKGTWIDSV